MYRGTYGVNLMELCVSDDIVFENGKYYLRMFIFPDHDNTKPFVGLKESFIETFQKMPGFYKFSLNSQKLGKSAGFSISGY